MKTVLTQEYKFKKVIADNLEKAINQKYTEIEDEEFDRITAAINAYNNSTNAIDTWHLPSQGQGSGSGLPAVTAESNGKILMVVDGAWALISPSAIYAGSIPDDSEGSEGDVYVQI